MKKSMIMSLSLHHQSAIGLLASPRYTNGQRTLRRTSWVVWKTSHDRYHQSPSLSNIIFIFLVIVIIILMIVIINHHHYQTCYCHYPYDRHLLYNRRFLSIVFRRRYRPCLPLRFASDASASAEAGGVRWHPLSSSFSYSSFCHYHYLWSSYYT